LDVKIDILTLFPEMFSEVFGQSIVKRAIEKGKVEINIHNLRDYSTDSYKTVDDKPYGGGAGMVMKVDIIGKAIESIRSDKMKVIITDAGGKKFVQNKAVEFSICEHLVIVCGHYEGIDHRVHEHLADEVVSIGDYVLSGGEIPAMVIVDSVVRLLPEVLGNEKSLEDESHNNEGETEYPQYTRPEEYKGWKVPEVLLSGNHKEIDTWRRNQKSTTQSPD
jgi:tRNA (guanine37-N1)-methyltransferase